MFSRAALLREYYREHEANERRNKPVYQVSIVSRGTQLPVLLLTKARTSQEKLHDAVLKSMFKSLNARTFTEVREKREKLERVQGQISRIEKMIAGCGAGKSGRAKKNSLSIQLAEFNVMLKAMQ